MAKLRLPPPSIEGGEVVHLNTQQLESLSKAARLTFAPEQEMKINDELQNYVINATFEQQSMETTRAAHILLSLMRQLREITNKVTLIQDPDEPSSHHVHNLILEELAEMRPSDPVKTFNEIQMSISHLAAAAAGACRKHRSEFVGLGPHRKNVALREFIWHLADIFAEAGGQPNASFQESNNEDEPGKRDSLFLRFCVLLNSYLPSDFRARRISLPEQVHEVCKLWRDHQRKFLHCKLVGPPVD